MSERLNKATSKTSLHEGNMMEHSRLCGICGKSLYSIQLNIINIEL